MHHWKAITDVAWVGEEFITRPITGILVQFHGLGRTGMYEPTEADRRYGEQGILQVFPYYGPWSWMNREARAMVDDLIGAVYRAYKLATDIPLLLCGDSMGGGSALLYARYAQHPVAGVYANCPVCDYPFHFTERPDLPRTMYHAYGHYAGKWEAILEEHSPLHQVMHMPAVPYFIIHGDADTAVNKACHSDRMVQAMRARGLDVTYFEVPGMGHCGPLPTALIEQSNAFFRSLLRTDDV